MSLFVLGRASLPTRAASTSLHLFRTATAPTCTPLAYAIPSRSFSSTPAAQYKRETKKARPPLSKKALAAKLRKRAAKKGKSLYEKEKMELSDAIQVLRAVEVARPNATYELVVKTAMSKGTTVPKGRINWPRSAKSKSKEIVLVFAEGRQAEDARRAGADIVGGPEIIDGVVSGRLNATTFVCTPSLLRAITPRLGRLLGPRGLMPSERRGTVTEDFAGFMKRMKGTEEWKGDKHGTIRTPLGKMNWPVDDVVKNFTYFMQSVKKATNNTKEAEAEEKRTGNARPSNAITRVVLSSNFGPGISLAVL